MKNNMIYNTIIAAIILIILSTFVQNYDMKFLVSFFLMTIIIFWITNNFYQAVIISFIINLLFYLFNYKYYYEGFDNKDNETKGEIDVNKLISELSGKKQTNKDDEITEDEADTVPTKDNEYMVKSAKAQRETHRLIDTIKQLQDTVENLTPALKQGASIIEQFKKLNLVN